MAAAADKVMDFVEKQLKRDPKATSEKLFEGAKKIDNKIGKLSLRQFHAKYPLQVKRRRNKGKKAAPKRARRAPTRTSRAPRRAAGSQDAVRRVMLRFAKDISAADKTGTIDILANIDRYVSDVIKAAKA